MGFFTYKWIFLKNHKDIGTLYPLFGAFSGIIGTLFSVIMRMELINPGDPILNGNVFKHFDFKKGSTNFIIVLTPFLVFFFILKKFGIVLAILITSFLILGSEVISHCFTKITLVSYNTIIRYAQVVGFLFIVLQEFRFNFGLITLGCVWFVWLQALLFTHLCTFLRVLAHYEHFAWKERAFTEAVELVKDIQTRHPGFFENSGMFIFTAGTAVGLYSLEGMSKDAYVEAHIVHSTSSRLALNSEMDRFVQFKASGLSDAAHISHMNILKLQQEVHQHDMSFPRNGIVTGTLEKAMRTVPGYSSYRW